MTGIPLDACKNPQMPPSATDLLCPPLAVIHRLYPRGRWRGSRDKVWSHSLALEWWLRVCSLGKNGDEGVRKQAGRACELCSCLCHSRTRRQAHVSPA